MALKEHKKGMPVFANYGLKCRDKDLTDTFFRNYKDFPIFKACVCADEISMYYSARRSASKQNLTLRPFILQTRKRTLKFLWSAQQLRLVDINLRENTDGIYTMHIYVSRDEMPYRRKPEDWEHREGDTYYMKYEYHDAKGRLRRKGRIIYLERFFPLYDTNEIIDFEYDEDKKTKKQVKDDA